MIHRRDLLNVAACAGAVSLITDRSAKSAEGDDESFEIVDTNVSLFQWPCRCLPLDTTSKLIEKYRSLGIRQAWAGSFEGVLHRDVAAVNQRLVDACKRHSELIPIGTVNPTLPDWEDDLRRCINDYKMPGIRLHPNYHGYQLDDPRFVRLLQQASEAGRLTQIVTAIEDTRTQHPMLRVADVDLEPIPEAIGKVSQAKLQILNYRPRTQLLGKLAKLPNVYFDTARVEGTDGVPDLLSVVPQHRVLFGTHAPFLIPEAALIRVHESSKLDIGSLRGLLADNARTVLG